MESWALEVSATVLRLANNAILLAKQAKLGNIELRACARACVSVHVCLDFDSI